MPYQVSGSAAVIGIRPLTRSCSRIRQWPKFGTETMARAGWDVGFEAGLGVRLGDGAQLFGAWRESFTDARGSGAVFGIMVGFPSDPAPQQ